MPVINVLDQPQIEQVLAVVRLGDDDHLGWWGSARLSFHCGAVWSAKDVYWSMTSACREQERLLGWAATMHLFSDDSPFRRRVSSWLRDRRGEDFLLPVFDRLRKRSTGELLACLPEKAAGERRGGGLCLGTIRKPELIDPLRASEVLNALLGGYRLVVSDFAAPYFDLVP